MHSRILFNFRWSGAFMHCLAFILSSVSIPAIAQTLSWEKQYNGPNNVYEAGVKVKSDAAGNVYVLATAERDNTSGERDIVTIKYNAAGVQQWAVRYDRTVQTTESGTVHTRDEAIDLLVDAAGNVYVTGTSFYSDNCGFLSAITIKYNTSGVQQWKVDNAAVSCVSDSQIQGPYLGMDGSGNIYISLSYALNSQGGNQLILQKFTPAGTQVWRSAIDGATTIPIGVYAMGLYTDAAGNSYIWGDSKLFKYNNAGVLQWQMQVPASYIRVDASGNVYATDGGGDVATTKYNAAGVQQWKVIYDSGDYYDDNNGETLDIDDEASGLLVDASGNAYVIGRSTSRGNCHMTTAVALKYNAQGVQQWVRTISDTDEEPCTIQVDEPLMAMDGAQNLYVAVSVYSSKITVKKISPANSVLWSSAYYGHSITSMSALGLHVDGSGNAYVTGRVDTTYTGNGNVLTLKYAGSGLCTASGTILREYWANVPGRSISNIPVNTPPTSTSQLTIFRTAAGAGDNYAQRIRGYICAPLTGSYTFFIQGDDVAELYLSTDNNPANKKRIASVKVAWDWAQQVSQKSSPITLVAGKSYYVEVLHKEGSGGDMVRVGWRTPTMATNAEPVIIPGSVLSPYIPAAARREATAEAESVTALNLRAYPNPTSGTTTVEFTAEETGWLGVRLYNLQGQPLQQLYGQEVEAGTSHQQSLDVSSLPSGLYLLRMVNGKRIEHHKLLVTH